MTDSLRNGERQVAPTLDGIRADHRLRYEFVLKHFAPGSRVLDLACGVGYGSDILAKAGHNVLGVDISAEAIDYAKQHYSANGAEFLVADVQNLPFYGADVVVCFETIEHIEDPLPMLRRFRGITPKLIASVPNEDIFPYKNYKFHHRHYTKTQITDELAKTGWGNTQWYGQEGPESEVEPGMNGRTLISISEHVPPQKTNNHQLDHVVILGLGPSLETYVDHVKRLGGRKSLSDEVWGINAVGDVVICDRVFHMDDMRVQEARAKAKSY